MHGQGVFPLEVEEVLRRHPAVAAVGVGHSTDSDGLLKPRAFVLVNGGHQPSDALAADLETFTKQSLAPHKYPRWIRFRDDLPRPATGKLQRYKLAQEPGA